MVQSYCLKAKHLACSTLQSTAPQYTRTSLGKIQHSSRDSQLSTFSTECKLRLVGTKLSPCWLRPWQPSVFHRFQRCSPSLGLEQTLKMPHTFSNIHQPAQYDIFARWLQHGAPFLDLLVAGKELQCWATGRLACGDLAWKGESQRHAASKRTIYKYIHNNYNIHIQIYTYIYTYTYIYIYIYIFRLSFKRNCQVAVGWCAQDITRLQRCLRTSASTQACTILHVGSNCKPELCPTWSWDLGSMAMSRR